LSTAVLLPVGLVVAAAAAILFVGSSIVTEQNPMLRALAVPVITAVGMLAAVSPHALAQAADAEGVIATVKYVCAEDETIEATYYADKVDLVLSDGRSMSVPQAMSGSGARYANADESIVFWNKGDTAFITEGDPDRPTFNDCIDETKKT
jgi:membrane-bound inhibitor of C-type lysozyme